MRAKALAAAALGLAVVIFAPLFVTAFAVFGWAWWRGWSPTRPRYILPAVWVLPAAVWVALGLNPVDLMVAAWHQVQEHDWVAAQITTLPLMIPAGVTAGALLWASRWSAARAGQGFGSARAAEIWQDRQFDHAMRRARFEARRPGLVPMLDRRGNPVLGRVALRTMTGAGELVPSDPRLLTVPMDALDRHIVVVGEPGAGKTVLLLRLMRGWSSPRTWG